MASKAQMILDILENYMKSENLVLSRLIEDQLAGERQMTDREFAIAWGINTEVGKIMKMLQQLKKKKKSTIGY